MATALRLFVAGVWLVHGLYNKLLGGSPRHLAIVQSVPGLSGSMGRRVLVAVAVLEISVAVWTLSRRAPRLCAATQTGALLAMNTLELTFARPFLLWPAGLVPINLVFLSIAWYVADPEIVDRCRARLRRHPFAIAAHFDEAVTLTYALPAGVLRQLLPPGLELDTFGEYGFIAVALVRTRNLRPAGWPAALGQDFFLAGYRVFTRFRASDARRLRGLRILRSDTDKARMVAGGNLLTHYNYHRCAVSFETVAGGLHVVVTTPDGVGDLDVWVRASRPDDTDGNQHVLPTSSPFASVREARRFAGPLPFTFDYESDTHSIVAIEARREHWHPVPIDVDVRRIGFFDQPAFAGCTPTLAAAFRVSNIDYRWNAGVLCAIEPEKTHAF
jgi:hypothetical protein